MISHDANMICGHLNKLQAYMNVGEFFFLLCYKLSTYSFKDIFRNRRNTQFWLLQPRGHQITLIIQRNSAMIDGRDCLSSELVIKTVCADDLSIHVNS